MSLIAGVVVQQRLVCCFDNLCFETATVIRVETLAVPILIYCGSVLAYKFSDFKCFVFPESVHESFLVLVFPTGLVMASDIR